jgi:hypothetical protein
VKRKEADRRVIEANNEAYKLGLVHGVVLTIIAAGLIGFVAMLVDLFSG